MIEPTPGKLHALVVDDEPMIRELIAAYLTHDGHTVETAENGRNGLEKFRAGRFDLVIVSLTMPEMNGEQLAPAIKQSSPNMPVIMLAGFDRTMQTLNHKSAGAALVLSQPITLTAFRKALAQVKSAAGRNMQMSRLLSPDLSG